MKLFDGGRTTVRLTRKQSVLGVGVASGVLVGLLYAGLVLCNVLVAAAA